MKFAEGRRIKSLIRESKSLMGFNRSFRVAVKFNETSVTFASILFLMD